MKNFAVQEEHGQCGVYALANAIHDQQIYELYADKYNPCGSPEMNKILRSEGYEDITVSSIVSSLHWTHGIPISYIETLLSHFKQLCIEADGDNVFPLILIVQTGATDESLHAVTLYITKRGMVLSDPLNPLMKEVSISDLDSEYSYISGMLGIANMNEDFVAFHSDVYNGIFYKQ